MNRPPTDLTTAREASRVPTTRNASRARADLLPILLAAAVGALLAAIDLGSRSLWLDEGSTFAIVSQHGAALWHGIAGDGGNQLLYYLVMHVVIAWFGDATWVMRLPSVIANGLTGALVATLALRLFPGNRRLAAAAGLLAVVSLPLVYWGQNARGYAWLVTLSVASFLALTAILQTPAGSTPSRRAVVAYVLTTVAALYMGYDVALVIPAQLALLLIHRERARLVIGCLALIALLSVPLLVLAVERGSGQLFWVTPLSWRLSGQAVLTLFSAAYVPDFHRTATTVATLIVMGLAVLAGFVLAARELLRGGTAPRRGPRERAWPLLFILTWLLVPTLVALIAYRAGEPIELPRVTILEFPALALLLAWLLLRPQASPLLGAAALAVILALRLLQVIPSYGVSSEPWRVATAYVLRSTPATRPACVIFYAQDGREALDYYLRALRPGRRDPAPALRPVLPALPWGTIRPYVERYATLDRAQRARVAQECPRLWLISSHAGQANGTAQSVTNLRRGYGLQRGLARLYAHSATRTLGWASTIHITRLW
ncbi:MAG: glycosyltransferase family 39 protein [Acidobacteriota bacterium]|nr:glycosyltransferase family 39 protein [Acidobacteriota bacterium]